MVKLIGQICRIFNQYYAAYLTNIPNLFMEFEMERTLNNFALLFETFSYLKFKNDVVDDKPILSFRVFAWLI